MIQELRRAVRAYRDEMAQFTGELIAIPTENPPGRFYERCLRRIADQLEALGFSSRVEPVPDGDIEAENRRFWLRSDWGQGDRAVYFHGHVDVVPAFDPSQFVPQLSEETIFGRGSTDMKGGLVSMIYAMKALASCGVELAGRIALRIVPDEETGGELGSRTLRRAGRLFDDDAVAMLTAEPTGGVVWNASRGAITCRVHTTGRTAHVGHAYRGVNAFEKAVAVADALRVLKNDVASRKTAYPIEPEAARHSILMMGGEVQGGANFNVVPERFSFTVDRRINPEEDYAREKERLLDVIETNGGTVELIQEARAAAVSSTHPAARALGQAIEEVRGEAAPFELCPGLLEIRFYAENGIPAFAYGPGLLSVAHGPNEFVKRRDIEECALVYALFATRLLS
ncbi:MAG TPA: ArgE/DapE family deacylase [Vicinamibacteria bacterium]|nr:ArgE/DapE family deacylase [Vicinamibacteria bacterium]